jgi:hypothetical protein
MFNLVSGLLSPSLILCNKCMRIMQEILRQTIVWTSRHTSVRYTLDLPNSLVWQVRRWLSGWLMVPPQDAKDSPIKYAPQIKGANGSKPAIFARGVGSSNVSAAHCIVVTPAGCAEAFARPRLPCSRLPSLQLPTFAFTRAPQL